MTREELDDIIRTLPGVFVRWSCSKDMPGVMALERATLGDWDEREFRDLLRRPAKDGFVMYVAECGNTQRVRGFCLYMSETDMTGARILRVLNFAAGDPVARRHLIEKVRERAVQHDRELVWNTPTY